MAVVIHEPCQQLLNAAALRWPDVYGLEFCAKALQDATEHSTDLGQQLLRVRALLLKRASYVAGTCRECSLHANRVCGSVFGDGVATARVMVVGEGPGQYEQRSRVPFTHTPELAGSDCFMRCANFEACFPPDMLRSGERLPGPSSPMAKLPPDDQGKREADSLPAIQTTASMLDAAIQGLFYRHSWNRRNPSDAQVASDIYITNVVKCRSCDKVGTDTTPAQPYIEACHRWLDIQLMVIQPRIVIVVGKPAASYLLDAPDIKITKYHGNFGPRPAGKWTKLPASVTHVGASLHPSYLHHQPISERNVMLRKMRRVFELVKDTLDGGH